MELQELRIGNWVRTCTPNMEIMIPGLEAQVQAIDFFGKISFGHTLQKQGFKMHYKHVMAIPLTSEWLESFGLTKAGLSNLWPFNNTISFNPAEGSIMTQDLDMGGWYELSEVKIQYVHQFQNLYFALTGEELQIKTQ